VGLLHLLVPLALAASDASAELIWQVEVHRLPASALAPMLNDARADVRARAARAAGRLHATATELSGRIVDSDPAVRREAAIALGSAPDGLALARARLAVEPDRAVQASLIQALGRLGETEDAARLVAALEGPHTVVAVEALGRLGVRKVESAGSASVVAALTRVLQGPSVAFGEPGEPVRFFDERRHRAAWALSRTALVRPAPADVAALRALALHDGDPRIRAWLVRAVGEGEGAAPFLLQAAKDPAPEVRLAALRAAARGACVPGHLPPLAGDPDTGVRTEALAASAACPDVPSATLRSVLVAGTAREQAAALTALAARKDLPLPLADYQAAPWPIAVQIAAVESTTARPRLLRIATRHADPRLRSAATGALLDADAPPRTNEVAELLAASDPVIVAAAAESAAAHPDPAFEKPLLAILGRADSPRPTAVAAVRALDALYATGRLARPNADARALVQRWLWLPELAATVERLRVTVGVEPAATRHPARALPSLAEAERVRSARVITTEGELRIQLFPEVAPLTVWNFATLAESGYFDGLTFHRVVPDFVIQTGDPRGDGWGGSDYLIPDELSDLAYTAGTVGMALSGPDTGGSQWFVTTSPQPHLDFGYTVFGRLVSGLPVARAIDSEDRILAVVIERVSAAP
jgi:cyclophilin family peptidyl-prolyl cis-trans isomerase/HEAT repeat protein